MEMQTINMLCDFLCDFSRAVEDVSSVLFLGICGVLRMSLHDEINAHKLHVVGFIKAAESGMLLFFICGMSLAKCAKRKVSKRIIGSLELQLDCVGG